MLDVMTLGYPESAIGADFRAKVLNLRCRKGYIQRRIRPGDIHVGKHPDGFELSFLVSPGLSGGAPLFYGGQQKLIGICVASYRSEQIDDSIVEIDNNGHEYRETRLRIEQYGFAHDIRPLFSTWRPELLEGKSLSEAIQWRRPSSSSTPSASP
jgi:hypothetical protein